MTRPAIAAVILFALSAGFGSSSVAADERYDRVWLLMGTAFEVTLYAPDSVTAVASLDAGYRAAARIDSLMSLYRPESELVRINRDAFRSPVPVSIETFAVLEEALRVFERTDGAFDVTVKPAMDAWGFYRKIGRTPDAATLDSLADLIDARGVHLDRASRTVRLEREGMSIDLGGIAKGYALDQAARSLRARGITAALLNLGGNILLIGAPPGSAGWPVGIVDPRVPESLLTTVELRDCAISSSGGYENYVILDGIRYGHIMDPRSARPVAGISGTCVIAADGMTSDILSTSLLVLGRPGMSIISNWPGITGALIAGDPAMGTSGWLESRGALATPGVMTTTGAHSSP